MQNRNSTELSVAYQSVSNEEGMGLITATTSKEEKEEQIEELSAYEALLECDNKDVKSARFKWLDFARFIGSGFLASVSYLDPGEYNCNQEHKFLELSFLRPKYKRNCVHLDKPVPRHIVKDSPGWCR